jgi:predicted GNAT family acetyltransferase
LKEGKTRTPKDKIYNAEKGSVLESLNELFKERYPESTNAILATTVHELFDKDELVSCKTHTAVKKVKAESTGVRKGGAKKSATIGEWIDEDDVDTVQEFAQEVPEQETSITDVTSEFQDEDDVEDENDDTEDNYTESEDDVVDTVVESNGWD